ncbi:MAG: SMC-Scp complex subunit ScpB [Calditrichaeota bacterium]|nr:MAG: SMC-Scp complex subunit ScpB [Calditrichota bacterium]
MASNTELNLLQIVEALLFASDEPMTPAKMREIAPELKEADIKRLVETLNQTYEQTGRAFRIHAIAGGYQMFTEPRFAEYVERLYARRHQSRLSAKALETLAIIAYKQPITRHEIEAIRGVNVDGVLRTLLARNLITIAGTADTPGNPFLYRTTRQFLEYFGLKHLKDLPRLKELNEIFESDSELRESIDQEILKELAPEILGLEGDEPSDDEQNRST